MALQPSWFLAFVYFVFFVVVKKEPQTNTDKERFVSVLIRGFEMQHLGSYAASAFAKPNATIFFGEPFSF